LLKNFKGFIDAASLYGDFWASIMKYRQFFVEVVEFPVITMNQPRNVQTTNQGRTLLPGIICRHDQVAGYDGG